MVQEPVKHVVDEKHKDVNTFEPRCKPKKKFKRFLHRGKPYQHKSVPLVIYLKKISNCNGQKRTFLVIRVFSAILNSEEKSFNNKRYNDGHNNLVKERTQN